MNFSSDSVKLEIRPHKEDFYHDVETPHGHFFAVLDFAPHDYVNLTPALKGRLEMIVASFASTPRFSADLFLGFLAEEINNFLNNLSKQSEGPALLCSAALCLVNGKQLSYFLCGDVLLNILASGRLLPLYGAEPGSEHYSEQLGARNLATPLTNQVKSLTLNDSDIVLIMTQGVGRTLDHEQLAKEVMSLRSSEPKVIRDALLASSAASRNDRTLVVIGGPYTLSGEPTLVELSKAVASLAARMDALSDSGLPSESVRALQSGEGISRTNYVETEDAAPVPVLNQLRSNYGSFGVAAALATLVIALVGGLAGSWFQSRMVRRNPEVWSVRTSGTQIDIARLDENGPSKVTFALEQPASTTGEQKFSSFTDVKQYLEMISRLPTAPSEANQQNPTIAVGSATQPAESKPADSVVEYRAKSGDSLMRLAWRHKVSPDRLKELNPKIAKWRSIKIGQRIALPSPTPANQPASAQGELAGASNSGTATTEITVEPGDSIMKLARRHNSSAEELRKLNPSITRWPRIQIGQRIVVPSTVSGTATSLQPQAEPSPANQSPADTTEFRLRRGDSLNQLARRFNTTAERIKELNPQISNWRRLQIGQKVIVPTPAK